MNPEMITDLMREAVYIVIVLVSVIIVPSLIVGLIVSIFQAATQINEQTLGFLPRLVTSFATLLIFGPWIADELVDFTEKLFTEIPSMLG